ncbi:MAG: hypothetical protein HC824_13175 [Synechococcales cyanobacterium RM1_1_8]|nr:hypothetical protein [Synechococcales cyanobacterium RM1_1_8]
MTARFALQQLQQFTLAATLAATSFLVGCSTTGSDRPNPLLALAQGEDQGNFSIAYRPVEQSAELTALKQILQTSGTYEATITDLNAALSLPEDVKIEFLQCGSEDAYYDPNRRSITLCYELIQRYTKALGSDDGSLETAALHAGLFTLFHELGHALIDVLALPITGREEDTADEFAAVMLLWSGQGEATLSGAEQFAVDAEEWEAVPYWDEHGTDMQRYYNIACYVYGSDSQRWQDLIGPDRLPEERAELCAEDYWRKSNSWNQLLAPYLKRQIELTALNETILRNAQRGF